MKKTIISVLLVVLAVCLLTACAARAPADDLTATQNETEVAKDITPADGNAVENSETTDKVDTEPTTVPNKQTVTEQKKAETTTAKGVVKPDTTKHTTAPAATKRAETTTKKRVETTTAKRVETTTTVKKPAVATTQKHTEPTTAKKPTPTTKAPTTQKAKPTTTVHQHTYKAIYREEPIYEEQPRYKCVQHFYCSVCGLDFTELARENGTDEGVESAEHLKVHIHSGRGKLVEELIGYEKVQVGTKKVIDHYECTGCGATKK